LTLASTNGNGVAKITVPKGPKGKYTATATRAGYASAKTTVIIT
jgi:hypothetical protein